MAGNRRFAKWWLGCLAPAALIAVATACGPVRRGSPVPPAPALLFFTNEGLYPADVFVTGPGVSARRVGTVMAGQTDTLVVPADLATRGGTLNVVARLLGRSAIQSGPVSIRPGEHYDVRLPLDARLLGFLPAS